MHIIGRCDRKCRRSIDIRASRFLDNVAGLDAGLHLLDNRPFQPVKEHGEGAVIATLSVSNPAAGDSVNDPIVLHGQLAHPGGIDPALRLARIANARFESSVGWWNYAGLRRGAGLTPAFQPRRPYPALTRAIGLSLNRLIRSLLHR